MYTSNKEEYMNTHVNTHMIRVSEEAYETIRKLAFQGRISMREVVDIALLLQPAKTAPVTFEVSPATDDGTEE
jgi:hypothetical protein